MKLFCGIIGATLIGLIFSWIVFSRPSIVLAPVTTSAPLSPLPPAPLLRLTFVGDIMLDRGVALSVQRNGAGDFDWLFGPIAKQSRSDILFGNLEGPLSDRGEKVGSIYSFRMSPQAAAALAAAGFTILSSANNHIGDWGREAAEDTLHRLAAVGITSVGFGPNWSEVATPKIVERNGLRVGFLAFSDVGPNWLAAGADESGIIIGQDKNLPSLIRQASAQVDHLVVSFHFGEEYKTIANDRQRYLAHLAIDNGARLVIGHHPHVVEEVERYGAGLIAYSLGNFIFDQAFSEETMRGLVLEVTLDRQGIQNAKTRASHQDSFFRPHLSLESADV